MSNFKKLLVISALPFLAIQLQGCDQQKVSKIEEEKDKKASSSVYSREMLENIEKDVTQALQKSVDRTEAAINERK